MKTLCLCCLSLLCCWSASCALQAPPLAAVPSASAPPVIDGDLSGGEWQQAARVGAFVRTSDSALAAHPATAAIMADATALYVGFTVFTAGGVPKALPRERDGAVWEDDAVELFLDPGQTRSHFYQFIVNASGAVYDARDGQSSFNANLTVKTRVGERSWTVEAALPFAALGMAAPRPGEQWGATFCRDAAGDGTAESSTWADTGARFEMPAQFGTLIFGSRAALQLGPVEQPGAGQWSVPAAVVSPDTVEATLTQTIRRGDTLVKTLERTGKVLPGQPLTLTEVPPSFTIGGTYVLEISALAGGQLIYRQSVPFTLRGQMRLFVSKTVLRPTAAVVLETAAGRGQQMEAQLALFDAGGAAAGAPLQMRLEEGQGTCSVPVPETAGRYVLRAVLSSQGKEVSRVEETVERAPRPPWLGSAAGRSGKVQAGFTPVSAKGAGVSCWGRTYDFGPALFPQRIVSAGAQVLAAPVHLTAVSEGRALQWRSGRSSSFSGGGLEARRTATAAAPGFTLSTKTLAEYDGCLTNDLVLHPDGPRSLDRLVLEIPLLPEHARYLHAAAANWSDSYAAGVSGPGYRWERSFIPYVWLGDEQRGLAWFAESDEPFRLSNPKQAVQVVEEARPGGRQVVLRLNLIDHPVTLGRDLTWRFGLQATPVKAVPRRLPHLWHGAYYGMEKRPYSAGQALTYPAAGNLSLARGTLETVFTLEFDPAEAKANKQNNVLFSLKAASGNTVVAFWDYEADGVWFYVGVGAAYPFTYPIHLSTRNLGWRKGETHTVALTWGDRTRLYVDGKSAAESAPVAGWLTDPLDGVDLTLGSLGTDAGELTFHELRVSETPATAQALAAHAAALAAGGSRYELPDEPGTLLLDHFRGVDDSGQPLPAARLQGAAHGLLKAPGEMHQGGLYVGGRGRTVTVLDYLKSRGVEVIVYHDTWTDEFGLPTTTHKEELHSLVQAVHDRGMRLLLYFGYGLAGTTEQMKQYHDIWTVWPLIPWSGGKPERTFDAGCNRSELPDFIADGMTKLATEFDLDGVYLDGTTEAFGCVNYNHRCGYLRDGQWVKTHPIWANRDFMRRIYTIFHERRPNALVDSHMSGNMIIPELSFCDSYWDGEQFEGYKHGDTTVQELMPLDSVRAEFMGKQWGLRAEFLNYEKRPFTTDEALAFVLLHDMYVRAAGLGEQFEKLSQIWKAFDTFGTDRAQWLPYWQQRVAVPQASGVYCSAYKREGRGALLVVSNLTADEQSTTVRLDRGALGLSAGAKATDAVTGEALALTAAGLRVRLGSMKYLLVRVEP